jgi:hypothetical protein
MKKTILLALPMLFTLGMFSCTEDPIDNPDNNTGAQLKFKFTFDENQERLNNIGLPAAIPAGHAAQTPDFNAMSIHYIELAPNAFTPLGQGDVAYSGEKTSAGGDEAIDFDKAIVSNEGTVFLSVPISDLEPGTYDWIRTSVTYQNYKITFNLQGADAWIGLCDGEATGRTGTVASFLGYNTYISDVQPANNRTLPVNDDKRQGFWAFEPDNLGGICEQYNQIFSGEAPEGATTVVNPLFGTSDIPPGSCVVTGAFTQPLVITGDETEDIVVDLSYSINNSFEWIDNTPNGQLDLDIANPANSDVIVDMGIRGLIPSWQ